MQLARQAEQCVLGGILLTCDRLPAEVEDLRPDDFAVGAHAAIFAAMRLLRDREEPIDVITVRGLLEGKSTPPDGGWSTYLAQLSNETPTAANLAHHAAVVRKEARRRDSLNVMREAVNQVKEPAADSDDLIAKALSDLGRITDGRDVVRPTTSREAVADEWRAIEERARSKIIPGLATSFPELDEGLGGMHPGNLVILAARPSMGKSSMARNILVNATAHSGKRGILFSLEMDRSEQAQAMLASEGQVNLNKIRTGKLAPEEYQRLLDASQALYTDRMGIVDKGSLRISEIKAIARQFAAKGGCDLVVVDYLQLVQGEGETREQEVASVSRGLKALAGDLRCPVIGVSQLSRAVESRTNKRPILSDLRESGALEQDANQVLFVYRDDYYDTKSKEPGVAEICIAKNRNGPTGTIKLRWVGKYTKFISERQISR